MCKYIVLMILCCAYVIQRGICQLETECGIVAPQAETLVINGRVVKAAEFPWHVGVYDKSSKGIEQICGGTIVSLKLVVTAAHCVYKDGVGPYQASKFAVAAGKIYRDWSATRDEKYVQKNDVTEIEIPEQYKGAVNAFTADIAMLVLEKSFTFNSFVRPVCVRFDYKDKLDGQYGKVAGWGLTEEGGNPSSILQTATLPFVRFEDCYNNSPEGFRPLIIHDKICAGYTNGTALCKGDSGGGLVFSWKKGVQDLYYLYGVVSTSPRNQAMTSCSAYAYTAFTDFIKHQNWFQDVWIIQINKGDNCAKANGSGDCRRLTQCPQARADLQKGIRPQICGFVEKTPLVCCKSISTNLVSKHEDCGPIPAEASRVSRTGKKAWDKCIDNLQYVYPCDKIANTSKIGRNYKCGHEHPRPLRRKRLVGGVTTQENEFPHMALLGFGSNVKNVKWLCGGTIVSKNFVMTAGHCAYLRNEGYVTLIRVGIARVSSPIDLKRLYNVSQIITHPDYKQPSKYNDIALLKTATDIILDNSVYPACLHVGNVIDDSVMMATGWGWVDLAGESSDDLLKVSLQKFTTEECTEFVGSSRPFNPEAQLCAGHHQESKSTCQGDGGGPLQIYNEDVNCMYTVVGITSSGVSCGIVGSPEIFTRVSHYISWIESIVWP